MMTLLFCRLLILKTCSKYVIIVGGTTDAGTAPAPTTFRVHIMNLFYFIRRRLWARVKLGGIIALFALRAQWICVILKITPTPLTVTAFCHPINFQYFQRRCFISLCEHSRQFTSQGLNRLFDGVFVFPMLWRPALTTTIVGFLLFLFKILKQDSKKEIHQKQISNDH